MRWARDPGVRVRREDAAVSTPGYSRCFPTGSIPGARVRGTGAPSTVVSFQLSAGGRAEATHGAGAGSQHRSPKVRDPSAALRAGTVRSVKGGHCRVPALERDDRRRRELRIVAPRVSYEFVLNAETLSRESEIESRSRRATIGDDEAQDDLV